MSDINNGSIMLIIYYVIINITTFIMFISDKRKSKIHAYRISEKKLLTFSFAGGAAGGLLAMNICNHKTAKIKFRFLMPIALILHIVVLAMAFFDY